MTLWRKGPCLEDISFSTEPLICSCQSTERMDFSPVRINWRSHRSTPSICYLLKCMWENCGLYKSIQCVLTLHWNKSGFNTSAGHDMYRIELKHLCWSGMVIAIGSQDSYVSRRFNRSCQAFPSSSQVHTWDSWRGYCNSKWQVDSERVNDRIWCLWSIA